MQIAPFALIAPMLSVVSAAAAHFSAAAPTARVFRLEIACRHRFVIGGVNIYRSNDELFCDKRGLTSCENQKRANMH